MTRSRSGTLLRKLPIIAIVLVAVAGGFMLHDHLSFESLAENREKLLAWRDANYLWSVLAFMAAYVAIVAFSLPGATVATLTGGFLFGLFPGVVFNVVAATIGAVAIFAAARAGFGASIAAGLEAKGGAIAKLQKGLRENEFSVLLLMRLVPVVPFFLANLIPAFVGVRLDRFAVSTFLGIIPAGLVFSSVGSGLGAVFARGETPDLDDVFTPMVMIPILGLAALSALPLVIKLLRRKDPDMTRIETDICIIGGGSAGLSVAAGAVQMGARVVLIEGGEMGGDCLNAGCVPSKALIAAAKHAHAMATGAAFGVTPVVPQIDYAAAKDHVARVIAAIAPVDSQERFEGLGVLVIRDWARFTSPTEVEVGSQTIRARRFVIATGSRPLVPPIPGIDRVQVLTNETIFALRQRPDHLIVIGGGPIGMEMAQAHVRLGCRVTVIEGAKAMARDDPDAAAVVLAALRAEGVEVLEGTPVVRISGEAGSIEVTLGDGRSVTGSHLLVAAGRQVALERLNLEAAGVAHSRKGVTVGADLRTTNRRIYAIGDAAGGLQFTHVAGYHAGVVIRSILFGLPSKARTAHIPWVTYTDPELAQVGQTEAEARAAYGTTLDVVRVDTHHNDRAQTEGRTEGFIKVMVVRGRPVGITIVGAQAGELIGLWALAIAAGLKMSAVAGMVAPYPTLGDLSKRAAGAYFSPQLFANPVVKRVVGLVQRWLP